MKLCIFLKRLAVLMLISLVAIGSTEAKLSANKVAKQKWFIAESPNFTVIADGGEKKAVKLAQNLERFRAMFELLSNFKLDETIRPVKVYATKRESTYEFFRGNSKNLKNTSGFFSDRISGNYSAIRLYGNGSQLSTLFHEYTHYLNSNLSSENSPYWYNEGAAEYLEKTEFKDDRIILLGRPNMQHLANINHMRWMPLDKLLNTTHINSKNRNERYQIYSQGWLLVHYFESDSTRTTHKKKFLKLLLEGVKPNDAIEQSTGLSFSDFEKELKKYSRKRKFNYSKITLTSPLAVTDIPIRKLKQDEALYHIGEFALQVWGDFKLSKPFFEKAIEINPRNANALAGLANTYLGHDDVKMTELISKAKSIEPNNAWVATISGHLNSRRMKASTDDKQKIKYWNQAVRDYNIAINSGKINVEAITAAANLYFKKDRYKSALGLLETAYTLAPNNNSIRRRLIALYLASDEKDQAQNIANKVRRNHHLSDKGIDNFEKWYAKIIKYWDTKNSQKSPTATLAL